KGVEGAFIIDVREYEILKSSKIGRNNIVGDGFQQNRQNPFVKAYREFDLHHAPLGLHRIWGNDKEYGIGIVDEVLESAGPITTDRNILNVNTGLDPSGPEPLSDSMNVRGVSACVGDEDGVSLSRHSRSPPL